MMGTPSGSGGRVNVPSQAASKQTRTISRKMSEEQRVNVLIQFVTRESDAEKFAILLAANAQLRAQAPGAILVEAYRDPDSGDGTGSGLSDAIEFVVGC